MKIPTRIEEKWLTRRSYAWAGYDVATSIYVGVVPSVVAPLYIRELAGDFQNPTAVWGILSVVAVLVSSLAALAAASLAGRMSRFTLLAGLSAGLLAAMVALAWNPNDTLAHAALAFVAAQSFYFAAMTIYESYLPDIVPPEARQKLSGFGWAAGYFGGIVAIIVLLVLIGGRPQSVELLALCFTALAVIGGLAFAIVIPVMRREGFASLSVSAEALQLGGVLAALRHWRSNPGVFQLLLGTMLVQMGIFVVVTFTTPILADRFGQSLEDLLWLLLIIHIVSVPSTLVWSHMMTGASRLTATLLLLASWTVVLLLLTFGTGPWVPLLTIMVIGCCLGATFSGLRGFLAENIGNSNPVALFALATAAGRMAAALGPALFSVVMLAAGQQVAMLLILLVFACGVGIILNYIRRESRLEEKPAIPPAQ
jgi:MFS transporter, UMF1 family